MDGCAGEAPQYALPLVVRVERAAPRLEDPLPPGEVSAGTPVLWLNPELAMTAGKAMAQAGHAAQLALVAAGTTGPFGMEGQ
ncbi:hypothetical protein [Trebonia sp.]|uniref:hypothetical protein n=1 Tax=Trebonia sp. TaxID=2767075 RepID=UPI002623C295|nr:hypothetical protein [Trebonia sp.]